MKKYSLFFGALFFSLSFLVSGCGSLSDSEEVGQQVGDVMASVDESGGSSGSLAALDPSLYQKTFSRLAKQDVSWPWYKNIFETEAQATACRLADTFSACSSNVITRTFGGCTVSTAVFEGTVTLTFSDAASDSTCQMSASGHSVTRVPNFTVTGRRGATLTVSKTATIGQKITRGASAGSFTFSNDGIRRVFVAGSKTLFDFTTETTSDIAIAGATRATRTMTGGTLKITNNTSGTTCSLTPDMLTWEATCNCPTSGSWTGECSDGKTFSVTATGCGTASLTVGSTTESITFDRCYSI